MKIANCKERGCWKTYAYENVKECPFCKEKEEERKQLMVKSATAFIKGFGYKKKRS